MINTFTGLYDLGRFKRYPRNRSHDTIDARWATTWKMIDGNVGARCRITGRGSKDTFQDLGVYAGTISRSGQKLVNTVAAENFDFVLFRFDVSDAFIKTLTFEESSALTGFYCSGITI